MILFQCRFNDLILSGHKYQTRRLWVKRRARPSGLHWAQNLRSRDSRFARLHIKRVWQHCLADITPDEVRAEGFATRDQFFDTLQEINGVAIPASVDIWAVEWDMLWLPTEDKRGVHGGAIHTPAFEASL